MFYSTCANTPLLFYLFLQSFFLFFLFVLPVEHQTEMIEEGKSSYSLPVRRSFLVIPRTKCTDLFGFSDATHRLNAFILLVEAIVVSCRRLALFVAAFRRNFQLRNVESLLTLRFASNRVTWCISLTRFYEGRRNNIYIGKNVESTTS